MAKDYRGQTNLPRGVRNNNPGNLIITGIGWQGKVPVSQNTDGHFEQFYTIEDGIRAMAMDILPDVSHGYDTINKLITEYAPPSENDTASYIQQVSNAAGIAPDAPLAMNQPALAAIIAAQLHVENGPVVSNYVNQDDIFNSIQLLPQAILQQLGVFVQQNKAPIIATLALLLCGYIAFKAIR